MEILISLSRTIVMVPLTLGSDESLTLTLTGTESVCHGVAATAARSRAFCVAPFAVTGALAPVSALWRDDEHEAVNIAVTAMRVSMERRVRDGRLRVISDICSCS